MVKIDCFQELRSDSVFAQCKKGLFLIIDYKNISKGHPHGQKILNIYSSLERQHL